MAFVAIKMGRRSGSCQAAAGREEGAYLNGYVTDPAAAGQACRPIFIATLRAVLFMGQDTSSSLRKNRQK